jgi:S1-C subfamily serine protease
MGDRPVIPMSGQSSGLQPNAVGNSSQLPPQKTKGMRFGNSLKSFSRLVRNRPTVWWPIILVGALLVVGIAMGGIGSPKNEPSPTANRDSAPAGGAPKVGGPINDVIVRSIVSIIVYENGRPCSGGSGTVVGDANHILTNNHVISSDKDCTIDEIRVQTVENSGDLPVDSFIAKVLISDEDIDLAILSIKPIANDAPILRPLELTRTNVVGQDIVVVGFPAIGGDSVTVSKGIISGFAFEFGVQWIKTDAAISGGNSGGAALDLDNRLIGIPTMMSQTSDGRGTDCRKAADTNGDGKVDEKDTCVGVGGSFALMATSDTAIKFARKIGLDLSKVGPISTSTTTTP